MSIGNWFKRLFSSAAPGDETSVDEARIDAGGGGGTWAGGYAGEEADEVAKDEVSEYDPPSE